MIEMEAWSRMTDVAQESIKGIIDIYNETNDIGANVEFVYIAQTQGSQADEKLLTAVAGGSPPAVYYADRFTVPQFAHQGFFTNINDFAEAAGVTEDQYFRFRLGRDRLQGRHLRTVVRHGHARVLVQQGHMAEAGLDPEAPPTNLEELKVTMEALTERGAGDAITRFGFHPFWDQAQLYTWGWCFRRRVPGSGDQGASPSATRRSSRQRMRRRQFVEEVGVQDVDAMQAACAGGACNGPNNWFLTGQVSCLHQRQLDGCPDSARSRRTSTTASLPMPGPDGPAPHASWAGGWSWCVPMGYEDVASAFDACAFFCGPEGQVKYNKDTLPHPDAQGGRRRSVLPRESAARRVHGPAAGIACTTADPVRFQAVGPAGEGVSG